MLVQPLEPGSGCCMGSHIFSHSLLREIPGDGFDVIFEASGAPVAKRQTFELVRPGGTIVQSGTLA